MGAHKMHENCLIGRQPILNRKEEVVSYELLFRSVKSRDAAVIDDYSQASASVIMDTLSEFGLERILGKHRGFLNLDMELLMSEAIEILPTDRVVLELLETIKITPEVVNRCSELKEMGFTLALDDHQFDPVYEELYCLAEIIKIDLLISTMEEVEDMVERFRPYPLKLLAEKVETREQFLKCHQIGFEFFQGYYFAKPAVIEKRRIDESVTTMLSLMRLLSQDADISEIENAFRKSPGLTYKLLLLVNSVGVGTRQKIQSIRHAVTMLGRRRIGQWVQLALFASDDSGEVTTPLMEMAAVRANLMLQLAERHPVLGRDPDASESAFMAGTLSLLEVIYDISLKEIVEDLQLSPDIKEALLSRGGEMGQLLSLAEGMENPSFNVSPEQLNSLGITQDDLLRALVIAYQWLGEAS